MKGRRTRELSKAASEIERLSLMCGQLPISDLAAELGKFPP
jgi:hypothetical protein